MVTALMNGLINCYGSLLQLDIVRAKHAIVAAISHTQHKLHWVAPESRIEAVRTLLIQCVQSCSPINETAASEQSDTDEFGFKK